MKELLVGTIGVVAGAIGVIVYKKIFSDKKPNQSPKKED